MIDLSTGVDLTHYPIRRTWNVQLHKHQLEEYNQVTRTAAKEENLPRVDLARQMPTDSSPCFDTSHFTNERSRRVGDLVARSLIAYLKQRFPEYQKKGASDAPNTVWQCGVARGKATTPRIIVRGPAGQLR